MATFPADSFPFMYRLLTRLLLWLVVLAIPLQGVAATAMMARAGTADEPAALPWQWP
ncbi:hypothetical protein [Ralstonia condita]|uniref:hypothetical protein n=1 Tax=Ralstonia condita TaxID=3058600 RepID=UPI00292E5930|nr:hypothetical protein [Ralstonia sp. LMG 7141]